MPNDATPPDTPEKPAVPGLRLLKLVGKGASGEVWTCRNETDTSFSAVKIVRRGTRPEKVWYRHELKALRKYARIRRKPDSLLDIKHVAVSEDKTFLYYTTPVADGVKGLDPSSPNYLPMTLKSLLADGNPILPAAAAEIAARIAEALQTLHEHGLLHRDVKPDNIIFCEGRAVLADIGLVTETEQDVSLAGTPRYMEPGQTPSVRTDLYALGKVLYEMANGKDPECFPDLASMQDSCDIGIFRLLNDICMRACGEESERYGKASQMLADLRRAASPDRPQEEAPNKLESLSGSKRRASIKIAAGLCLLAVVLCQTYISSLWPKKYGALLEFASTLKGVCYVAFVVLAALQARKRVARTMAVVLTAFCITAYLNGKIAQYFQEQEMERYSTEQENEPRGEDRQLENTAISSPAESKTDSQGTMSSIAHAQGAGNEWDILNKECTDLFDSCKYDRALVVAQKALQIAEQNVGPDHPDVATSLNNLGGIYCILGDYAKAEPLFKRSLAIQEKELGSDTPAVATSLNNLGGIYMVQGDYAKAEPLIKRSLAIREKALGSDHPDVATSLFSLADLYSFQDNYAIAEPLLKRSLAIRQKALAPDHPDVASSMNRLAELYLAQGDFAAAEPLFKRSLSIWERVLDSDHPTVAKNLENLAALYRNTKRDREAEPLEQRVANIRAMKR